jgi:hypothetical protein
VKTFNAAYIKEALAKLPKKALAKFPGIFKLKRSELLSQDWFLYWDGIPVHTTASTGSSIGGRGNNTIRHLLFSLHERKV